VEVTYAHEGVAGSSSPGGGQTSIQDHHYPHTMRLNI